MIHETALVDASAKIADHVEIGPYSVIGPEVEIASNTWIGPHVVIRGPAKIGSANKIFQFSSIGDAPQDKKYAGEKTALEIGDGNTIREFCTINRGTIQGDGCTRIGSDNWIMAYVHVAHDCVIGNHTIMANCVTLAGHVQVGDHAILGGFSKVHQFCRIGIHSFSGMDTGLSRDLPPYFMASGMPAQPKGINSEGLRRRDFSKEQIRAIKNAYKTLYRSGKQLEDAINDIASAAEEQPVLAILVDFLRSSERSIIR